MAGADYLSLALIICRWRLLYPILADRSFSALITCVRRRLLIAGADYLRVSWLFVAGADYLSLALIMPNTR